MSRFLTIVRRAARNSGESSRSGGGNDLVKGLLALITGVTTVAYGINATLYNVDAGHRAVLFNKFTGIDPEVITEGTHLRVPVIEEPFIFDIRTKPQTIRSPTGTRDLQTVDITLRVLYRPVADKLPTILTTLGMDYDERVLPSIVNETLKSVVAQFNASELITQREQVSRMIGQILTNRAADFHIILEDVSITHLTFGKEYRAAVEAKQVAQQEAERAKFIVKQALQDKKSTIIKAEGEARSAELIGMAVSKNPGYIELRRLDAAREIAEVVSHGKNSVYLDAESLMQGALAKEMLTRK